MKTLLYLEFRQIANYIRVTLRTPKRLIPIILFVVGILPAFLPMIMSFFLSPDKQIVSIPPETLEQIWAGLFFLLAVCAFYLVYKSFEDSLLVFSLPEIDYVFASPLNRRVTVGLKMLKIYGKVGLMLFFFFGIFLPMFLNMSGIRPGLVSFVPWLVLTMFAVTLINICLAVNLVSTYRAGRKWWIPSAVKFGAYGFLAAVALSVLLQYHSTHDIVYSISHAFSNPVITTILLPISWVADLAISPFAGWEGELGLRLGVLGLITLISLFVVVLRPENPYEPSIPISVRTAAVRKAIRQGGVFAAQKEQWRSRQRKFSGGWIRPFGTGALSLVWKNCCITARQSGRTFLILPVIVVALVMILRAVVPELPRENIEYAIAGGMGYLLFITSTMMLQGFRADLKQANILKPMPISAAHVIAVQPIHSVVMASCVVWCVIAAVVLFYGFSPRSIMLMAALAFPFITYTSFVWQMVAALIYPHWDDFSQQYLGGLVSGLACTLTIGPSALVIFLGWRLGFGLVSVILVIAGLTALTAVLGIMVSAYLYRKYDPTNE